MIDRTTRQLILAVLPALAQPPPDASQYFGLICNMILAIIRLPPDPSLDIRHRLFSHDENMYTGRDVFSIFSMHRYQFFELTGETPETFLELVTLINPVVEHMHTLTVRNRILLFMIWLRSYPCYSMLSSIFNISTSTVKDEIKNIVTVFDNKMKQFIVWPQLAEWLRHRGRWEKLFMAVGAIDGTSHEIYRPSNEPQEQYYSGHRNFHAIHSQIVVNNDGKIVHVESGFLGHQNDAQQYHLMQQIGAQLPFPDECVLLGDKIYPNRHPLMTPYSAPQIARAHGMQRRKCIKFNRYMRKYRVVVENSIAELKCYRAVSTLWRHPRAMLPPVVNICASLVNRRKQIELIL